MRLLKILSLNQLLHACMQLRHISKTEKMLNSNISSTRSHNMVNLCPLTFETGWRVWGTLANFNRFRVLASLLHRRRLTEVNQTLHDIWPSPGLVHCIHFWRFLSGNGILPGAVFTLRPSLAFSYIGSVTPRHSSSGFSQTLRRHTRNRITELSFLVIFNRARHLYSEGAWPSRWA